MCLIFVYLLIVFKCSDIDWIFWGVIVCFIIFEDDCCILFIIMYGRVVVCKEIGVSVGICCVEIY